MSHRDWRPRGRPRTRWRDYVSRLAWERLGVPPEELEEVSGVREVWASLLRLLPPRPGPAPDKADEDGWMDGWMYGLWLEVDMLFNLTSEQGDSNHRNYMEKWKQVKTSLFMNSGLRKEKEDRGYRMAIFSYHVTICHLKHKYAHEQRQIKELWRQVKK
ncbi:hypothetical protein L3Q82_017837 [Scortum barcoo]|uniref:Uncharacterized protein n=1 Tax=Scortum barcoo TaxID=214431 RepID=A0ACB8VMA4_9TELE|nr:hypothetical protein L3Q82_017837 [Scortum barcoo]